MPTPTHEESLVSAISARIRRWAGMYPSQKAIIELLAPNPLDRPTMQAQFSKWTSGHRSITLPNLLRLIEVDPLLNLHWLLTGHGSMRFDPSDASRGADAEQRAVDRARLIALIQRMEQVNQEQRSIVGELSSLLE